MNTQQNPNDSAQERFIQSILGLGAEWASFGLQIGTQALERSAKSLELAAKTLSTLSKSIEEVAARKEETAPEAPKNVVDTHGEELDSQDPARL
jgi:hypothetical protein